MLELEVILEFMCCCCGDSMGVTVKCACKSLHPGKSNVTSAKIPCPSCQGINHVFFSPEDGALIDVIQEKPRYLIPKPSYN
jgi:hypothetical protein